MTAIRSHVRLCAWRAPRSRPMRSVAATTKTTASAPRMYFAATRSRHPGEQALLAPGGSTGVEERRAGLEQAEVVGGENALALVAVLQHIDAVGACDWL